MKMEGRINSIQIIANDFNGFNNLCFRKLFNFLSFSASVVRSYGLTYLTTGSIGSIMIV